MLSPKLFLWASASLLTLFTTGLFGLHPQTSQVDVDDLAERVQVLETQVASLSTRVAELEVQTPEPTEEAVPEETPVADEVQNEDTGTAKATPDVEEDYEPVLSAVEAYPCEYDAFSDHNVCNFLKEADFDVPWESTGYDNEIFVAAEVIHPTDESPSLSWFFGFNGDDWLFLRGAIFLYDGQRHLIEIPLQNRYTDVSGGWVYEYGEIPERDITAFVDIIAADDVQVRLVGDDFNVDRALNEAERELLLRTLATYEQRGGQLPDNKDKLLDLLPDAESPGQDARSQADDGAFPVSGTMTATAANLRSGPGTDYDVVGQSQQGDTLEIVGQSDDGAWYQLDDSVWIAASLVEVALSGQGLSPDEETVNLPPQIISRHPSTAVSITPYDSPVNLGSMVHWYDCASYAPRTEYPLQILNSRTLDIDMLTYSGDGDLSMNLSAEDGTLVSSIYQGPAFEGRKTLTIELPPEMTSYVFTAEGRGCWTARLTGKD